MTEHQVQWLRILADHTAAFVREHRYDREIGTDIRLATTARIDKYRIKYWDYAERATGNVIRQCNETLDLGPEGPIRGLKA